MKGITEMNAMKFAVCFAAAVAAASAVGCEDTACKETVSVLLVSPEFPSGSAKVECKRGATAYVNGNVAICRCGTGGAPPHAETAPPEDAGDTDANECTVTSSSVGELGGGGTAPVAE